MKVSHAETENQGGGRISVGGQAVIEGVMMRSPNRVSVAVRRPDGEIEVLGWDFVSVSRKHKILALPIIRGMVNLAEMLYWGIKTLELSAHIVSGEKSDNVSAGAKIWSAVSLILGLGIAVVVFAYFPLWVGSAMGFRENPLMFNITAGVVRVALFLGYLYAISLMKDIKRLFRYHGAEHKTIFAFENNEPLTVDRIQKYSTFHPRCGTSFLLIVAFAAIVFFAVVDGIIYAVWGFAPKPVVRLPIHLLLVPVLAGVAYELLKLSDKFSRSSWMGKILVAPGLWLQHITTQPPDDSMIEVAVASLMDSIKNIGISDVGGQTRKEFAR